MVSKQAANESEITPQSIRREIVVQATQAPTVLYPAVAAVLGAFSGALFGMPTVALIVAGASGVAAVGALAYQLAAKGDDHARAFVLAAERRMESKRAAMLAELREDLALLRMKTATEQLDQFERRFRAFRDVLEDRFKPSELTFARYLGVAEQVFLSGLDNVRNAVITRKSIEAIDEKVLRERLRSLEQADTTAAIEREALQMRLKVFESSVKDVADLLVQNEQALTLLDQVTHRLASTKTERGMADSDLESAMAELQRMGARLSEYAHRH